MLEGDDLFENANETSYRICSVISEQDPGFVPWNRVFSAHWDPTDPDRRILCSQNGQLRVINQSNGYEKTFSVKSRRFIASTKEKNSDGKIVSYHFDKMCLLPNKPGEFIFLLGVSKSVMYSALPGYSHGSLSYACRDNSPLFDVGCPVFEIYSHSSRVTSMDISSTGHLIATGDELGNIKIINLFLFGADLSAKDIGSSKKESYSTEMKKPNFTSKLSLSVDAHPSTVYAVHWLPMCYGKKKIREFTLASGSNDRSVRLWKVISTKDEISISPLLLLSTMTSGILCISSVYLHGEGPAYSDDDDKHGFPLVNDKTKQNRKHSNLTYYRQGGTTVVTAGTSGGAVYVWRVRSEDIYRPANISITNTINSIDPNEGARDDGSRLISLVFASERPVVHVSISLLPSATGARRGSLVLTAADTMGVVKLHKELEDDDVKMESTESSSFPRISPLVYVSEHHYSAPVVACCFRRISVVELGQDEPTEYITDNERQLFTCISDGCMSYKEAKSFGHLDEQIASGIDENDVLKREQMQLTEYLSTVDTLMEERYPSSSLEYEDDFEEYIEENIELEPEVRKQEGLKDDNEHQDKNIAEVDEEPRERPPPSPISLSPSHVKSESFVTSKKSVKNVSNYVAHSTISGQNVSKRPTSIEIDDDHSLPIPSPAPVPYTQTTSPKRKPLTTKITTPKTSKISIEPYKSPSGIADTTDDSIPGDSITQKFPLTTYKSLYACDEFPLGTSDHCAPKLNSTKVLSNALEKLNAKLANDDITISTVETTSTMKLRAAIKSVNLNPHYNQYDYTKLTKVDDNEAAKRAPKKLRVPKQIDQAWLARKQNYCPTTEDTMLLYPSDPNVILKLQYTSDVKDSNRGFTGYNLNTTRSEVNEKRVEDRSGGLTSTIDPESLLPVFTLAIDHEKIFGPLYSGSAVWTEAQPANIEERERKELDDLLSLTDMMMI